MKRKRPKRIITAAHYRGIGEVVAAWARLESHMLQTLRTLLGLSKSQTVAVFWEMQFRNRVTRLRTLTASKFRQMDSKHGSKFGLEFNKLLDEIEDASFIRNLAAHAVWHKGKVPNTITPLYMSAKGQKIKRNRGKDFKEIEQREFSPKRFRCEAIKIANLAERFKEISSRHFGVKFLHAQGKDIFD
ncbi:MAG: hypothetical protein GEU87_09460 [Alphaproteobacteria bacterium]|nr:hypothetical protein [Alphaproteobacteria bacterium]